MVIDNVPAKRLRVKICCSTYVDTLEREINEWLSKAEGTVTNLKITQAREKNGYNYAVITYLAE